MTKYKTRREIKNGIIKWVSTPIEEEEDNQEVPKKGTLTDHTKKDLEIKRLEAIVEILESRIKQLETNKPKEAPSYDDKPVAAASSYDCYK